MYRTFAATLAVLCIISTPAFAQGTIRKYGGPPAPDPTVDRDQRRGARAGDPVQWEVRGEMQFCRPLMISNLRREGVSRPSMLSPIPEPQVGWSNDGGDWFLALPNFAPLAPCNMIAKSPNSGVPFAVYNNRNKRYLTTRLTWSDTPQYGWTISFWDRREHNGLKYMRFSLFSVADQRYLMLCHDDADARKNDEKLCYYNTDQERPK